MTFRGVKYLGKSELVNRMRLFYQFADCLLLPLVSNFPCSKVVSLKNYRHPSLLSYRRYSSRIIRASRDVRFLASEALSFIIREALEIYMARGNPR